MAAKRTPTSEIEAAPPPSDTSIKRASDMTQRILQLRVEIEERQSQLDELVKHTLPEFLHTIGLSSMTLPNGTKVELKTTIKASIPKDYRDDAFRWLDENGHGDIIKHDIVLSFGRDKMQQAQRAADLLRDEFPNIPLTDEASVHSGTLTALVKEQLGAGVDLPMDILGVMVIHGVEIKAPKAKKNSL